MKKSKEKKLNTYEDFLKTKTFLCGAIVVFIYEVSSALKSLLCLLIAAFSYFPHICK